MTRVCAQELPFMPQAHCSSCSMGAPPSLHPSCPLARPLELRGGALGVQYGGVSPSHLISEKAASGLPLRSAPGKAALPLRP